MDDSAFGASPKQVAGNFQLQEPLPFVSRYNIALSQEYLAVPNQGREAKGGLGLRWGLMPHWVKEEKSATE